MIRAKTYQKQYTSSFSYLYVKYSVAQSLLLSLCSHLPVAILQLPKAIDVNQLKLQSTLYTIDQVALVTLLLTPVVRPTALKPLPEEELILIPVQIKTDYSLHKFVFVCSLLVPKTTRIELHA